MGGISGLSHTPGDVLLLPPMAYSDKLCHAAAYAVLTATFLWAFSPGYRRRFPSLVAMLSVVLSFLHGCADEFHQSFVPLRCPDAADVVADTIGAFCCSFLWWWFWGRPGARKRGRQRQG